MSSIYIPNIEIPKSGIYQVSIDNSNDKDKTIMSFFTQNGDNLICHGTYEIIQVPSHGPLVDTDTLGDCVITEWYNDIKDVRVPWESICNAPVIIPADVKIEE